MTTAAQAGYVLVRDTQGQMKYYKDGQFFDVAEIDKQLKEKENKRLEPKKRKELKPLYSFDSKKKIEAKDAVKPQIVKEVTPVPEKKPVTVEKKITRMKPPVVKRSIPVPEPSPVPVEKKATKITPPPRESRERVAKSLGIPFPPEDQMVEATPQQIKKIETQPIKPQVQPVVASPIIKIPKEEIEMEEIKPHGESHQRRSADQDLITKKVEDSIVRLKIKFSDSNIEKRFKNILVTYFRGIRTIRELGYILSIPKVDGGMELTKDKIKIIVSVLEREHAEVHKSRRHVVAKPKENLAIRPKADLGHQLSPPPPAIREDVAPAPKPVAKHVPTMSKPPISRPVAKDIKAASLEKPHIEGLKLNRRLIGPKEELEYMDLENFRKLGRDEPEILSTLLEKFEVLKEQSLVQMVQGKQGWKKSPVYRLYLQMTYQAIQEGKAIATVIELRQKVNQESLTLSEYEMVGELNRKLAL